MLLTLAFLFIALCAYALFGGADFGGGILEATLSRYPHLQKKIQVTLAPVWEANHVWLIAVVVILFVGFPVVYAELMTMLFVPVSLALLGIIVRGAFFTFRKYDPEPDARHSFYSLLFRISSILTPLMYGFIVASMVAPFPVVPTTGSTSFAELYVYPWITWLGVSCAVFVFALFGYVAAVFLYGEVTSDEDIAIVGRRILQFFAVTFVAGGIVLTTGMLTGVVSPQEALNPVQLAAQVIALACILLMWHSLVHKHIWRTRIIAGIQVVCILGGWFTTQYPIFMHFADGRSLTIWNSSAPTVTLTWLNIGLVAVLSLVIPLLSYLYYVFRTSNQQ